MTGLTTDTAGGEATVGGFVGGLDDVTMFARVTALLGFNGDISGDVIRGFVRGSLGTTALLGFSGNISGDVILRFVSGALRTTALLGFSGNISGDVILRFVSGSLRTAALLVFSGNINGDVILGFVFGSLRATALLGWFRSGWMGDLLSDILSDREDQVSDLLGEVISAAVGSGDIVRNVINKVFDFFHDCDGEKGCVRRHDIRIK